MDHHHHQHHSHHHHRLPASTYSTVRLLPAHAVSGAFYGEHYRHIAAGPGPGAGPGGGGVHLIPARAVVPPSSAAAYQLYHARAAAAAHYAATVNPAKMSKGIYGQHQQIMVVNSTPETKEKESSINSWFTWKRKSKQEKTISTVAARGVHTCGQQFQQHSEYSSGAASKSAVPASLARLFAQPQSSNSRPVGSVKGKVPSTPCICSGLTESTFMAPSYFDEDDRLLEAATAKQRRKSVDEQKKLSKSTAIISTSSKSKTLRAIKSRTNGKEQNGGGTLRTIRSTGSLLVEATTEQSLRHREHNNGTLKSGANGPILPPLNQAASCDHLLLDHHNHLRPSNHTATVTTTTNRKSILECEVNAYELLKPPSKGHGKGVMTKSATIAVKSSRKSQSANHSHYEVIGGPTSSASLRRSSGGGHGSKENERPPIKGIFDPANSIRIAGQSVYSSFSFDDNGSTDLVLVEEQKSLRGSSRRGRGQMEVIARRQSTVSSLTRSKSTTSLSDWSFSDSNSTSNQAMAEQPSPPSSQPPKVANFHSILIEPEPDYDMDEQAEDDHHLTTKSMDRLDRISGSNLLKNSTLTTVSRNRRRSTSVTRPKVNPPPPPSDAFTTTTPAQPPPPPPPPPANFFDSPPSGSSPLSLSSTSLSGGGLKSTIANKITPSKIHIAPADTLSFQNELKEKLNQGVKSILKKTTPPVSVLTNSAGEDSLSSTENSVSITDSIESTTTDSISTNEGSSVEKRIHVFDLLSTSVESSLNTLNKPKKHVHFRMKQSKNLHNDVKPASSTSNNSVSTISRSRSASHLLITETIHELEEGSEGGEAASFYDDVALPSKDSAVAVLSSSRSFDDISIVSISSTASLRLRNGTAGARNYPEEKRSSNVNVTVCSSQDHQNRFRSQHQSHLSSAADLFLEGLLDDNSQQTRSQFDEDELEIDSFSDNEEEVEHERMEKFEEITTTTSKRSFQRRSQRSKLAANHHFDVRSSPTPPPVPARRMNTATAGVNNLSSSTTSIVDEIEEINNTAELEEKKNSSFGRVLRSSYSSGSVRSLLARKLTRGGRQEGKSGGSKLSNLFSVGKNSSTDTATSNEVHDDIEQADEHIYEELDSIFADKKKLNLAKKTVNKIAKENSSSSLFGARISRAEILDYLHDARGRLLSSSGSSKMTTSPALGGDDADEEDVEVEEVDEEIEDDEEVERRLKIITDLNSINTTDSGNSSFVDSVLEGINSINGGSSAAGLFIPGVGKSRIRKAAALQANNRQSLSITNTSNDGGDQQKVVINGGRTTKLNSINTISASNSTTVVVNRRNRVSNVSNSSSESCATSSGVSGVSSSLSDEVEDDEDLINSNSSNSSLGSLGNNGGGGNSSASASCYYGTCGPIGSDKVVSGTPTASAANTTNTSSTMVNSSTTLERNDSGVGVEMMIISTPKKTSKTCLQICVDCDLESIEVVVGEEEKTKRRSSISSTSSPFLCPRCTKRRNERKEIICEIVDTELKYGRDLKIIAAEFARPIGVAGLLTASQLEDIFLNLDELIEVNEHFAERLQDALEEAYEREDEDLTTVSIGQLFSECLLARISVFEQYCIRQGSASLLLNQLEKEKELLRIFLRVSQMENTLLRRMNLRSFLVVPVQRVTKYPLLLNRLHKVTPPKQLQGDREALREAQVKLEYHLESINQKTRGEGISGATSRIWRRISNLSSASIRSRVGGVGAGGGGDSSYMDDFGYVRLKKTALDQLKWPKEEARFDLIGKLSYMVEKKTGATTSSETINNISSSSNSATSRDLNSSAYHHSSASLFNLSTASTTTSVTSNNNNASTSSSFWSRTLKFTTANGILVTLSPSTSEDTTFHSSSNRNFLQEVSSPSTSEPNSLTLYDDSSADHGDSNTNTSSRTPFNTVSRRANSKSPSRLGSKVLSPPSTQMSNASGGIKEAVLLLFKEKSGRYVLCRSLNLAMCVVATAAEVDGDELFEIHELESKESLLLKGETHSETKEWLEQLRQHSSGLGNWRRRRNALPNIMLGSVVELQQQLF